MLSSNLDCKIHRLISILPTKVFPHPWTTLYVANYLKSVYLKVCQYARKECGRFPIYITRMLNIYIRPGKICHMFRYKDIK